MKILTIIFLFFVMFYVSSQEQHTKDTTAIVSFVDKIILKVNLDNQTESYIFNDENETLILSANNQVRLGISLDYEFIGLSINFAPKFFSDNKDDNLKGKSSFVDYRFRFFIKNWTHEIQYSKTQGFYLENTGELIPDWVEGRDQYLIFPGFKTINWGASTSYVVNPKFSLRNITFNTEWQKKSAGSFIPTIHYGYNRISQAIGGQKTIENNFDLKLALDYYYTLVILEKWYISPYISPALGYQFSNFKNSIEKESSQGLRFFLDGGLQLGYSSNKIIFGVNYNFKNSWTGDDNSNIINEKTYAKIYLGYRLDSPKAVSKKMEYINKKLGL